MKTITFSKYQGTGNDFVMIDNRQGIIENITVETIQAWCSRKFGIGADGLILIQNHPDCDFEMVYYNSDGSQSLCGNGSRCAVMFAHWLGAIGRESRFQTIDGPLSAEIINELVKLKMNPVSAVKPFGDDLFINTGSPHYIRFVDDANAVDVVAEAQKIRYNDTFKAEGTNVNFVSYNAPDDIAVRTYERGVEDETLSCGTGVTACALAMGYAHGVQRVNIQTPGGALQVSFEKNGPMDFDQIYLTGPAIEVFQGNIQWVA